MLADVPCQLGEQQGADLTGPVHGGVLGRVKKALGHGDLMLLEKVAAILPHHEQLGVRVLVQQALGLFDDILVIGPRQALVRRDDQAAIGARSSDSGSA